MKQQAQFGFAIIYVDDMAAARRFYTEVLGLKIQREAPTFVQFDHFALASDESMDGRKQTELYWLVTDAEAALAELRANAPIAMELRSLPFGKVFAVKDPTGQPRYLLELARNRPSKPA
jgi:catechol 2,3-dioxygenase-like lactoylglutathione lyase family enzyme